MQNRPNFDSIEKDPNLDLVQEIQDPQIEHLLLCFCAGLPKVNFILRTTNPAFIQNEINDFDSLINDCLLGIAGPMTTQQRNQVALPLSLGGGGIGKAKDIALSAFLGCLKQTTNLCAKILGKDIDTLLPEIISKLGIWNQMMDNEDLKVSEVTLLESKKTTTAFIFKNPPTKPA